MRETRTLFQHDPLDQTGNTLRKRLWSCGLGQRTGV